VKHKGNGNHFFTEECITKETSYAFFSSNVHYERKVALRRFMMNLDIKLFLVGLVFPSLLILTKKE
jgi:hypothetical protein